MTSQRLNPPFENKTAEITKIPRIEIYQQASSLQPRCMFAHEGDALEEPKTVVPPELSIKN